MIFAAIRVISWIQTTCWLTLFLCAPNDAQGSRIFDLPETISENIPSDLHEPLHFALQKAGHNISQLRNALLQTPVEYLHGMAFLIAYMPNKDLTSLQTDFLVEQVNKAYQARNETPWGNSIPFSIFLNDVLPYSNVDERRDNWRTDFHQRFMPIALQTTTIAAAVERLNRDVFDIFNVRYHATLREKPNQSPYESIAIGYASCTGLSILIADALRAVGIPARLAGTPQWTTVPGNHTWVEVWDGSWHTIEAASAGPYDQTWFMERASQSNPNNPMNRIYAVSYAPAETHFPMVWSFQDRSIPAYNVTRRYTELPQQ